MERPDSADLLREVLEGSPVATMVLDQEHRVIFWNRACATITGFEASLMLGTTRSWAAFYRQERPNMADLLLDGAGSAEMTAYYGGKCRPSPIIPGAWEAEDFFPDMPGGGKWIAFTAALMRSRTGDVIGAIETVQDITERKRAETALRHSEALCTQIIDVCPLPIFVVNKDHLVTHFNRACAEMHHLTAAEMLGQDRHWSLAYSQKRQILADLVIDATPPDKIIEFFPESWAPHPRPDGSWELTCYTDFRGTPRWCTVICGPLYDQSGALCGAVQTVQDVTQQKQAEDKLHHQSTHDVLTGLANRALLHDRLEQALAHAGRENRLIAVVFVNLDNFKIVNDTLGHQLGDSVLITMAERIGRAVRDGDTVSRIGGDEFVVVLYGLNSEDNVSEVVRRLIEGVAQPIQVDGHEFLLTCSCGVSLFPRDGRDRDVLLKNADMAMSRAKDAGRNNFRFYTNVMNDRVADRLAMELDLRRALDRGEFILYYQPQIDMRSGAVVGVEALLRWRHPSRGMVAPDRFIPLAEELGLIVPIGRWVMETACAQARAWLGHAGGRLRMAINLSARQFHEARIEQDIADIVRIHGGDKIRLELELTESMVMRDPGAAALILTRLREAGMRLSMDDFGTGYSSLGYLRTFPFDVLKIDQSFVRDILSDRGAQAIARAIISLAHSLDLRVIAEGVEQQSQFEFLKAEGCDEAQGYLFCRPLPAAEISAILESKGTHFGRA